MNKVVFVFRILSVLFTAVWGLFFGTLFPLYMIVFPYDTLNLPLADSAIPVAWLLTSLFGVILPCILSFMHKPVPVFILSFGCAVSVLIMHLVLTSMLSDNPAAGNTDAAITYLPLLFANLFIVMSVAVETTIRGALQSAEAPADTKSTIFEDDFYAATKEASSEAAKPAEAKSAEAKSAEAKSAEAKSAEAKSAKAKPASSE